MMKDIYGTIYCLTNEKQYFGQTTEQNIEKYLDGHRWKAEHGSERYIHRAIRKHGWDSFKKEVICYCGDALSLGLMEDLCINVFDSLAPNGYNLRGGGYHGKYSEDTKQQQSISRQKYIKKNPHFQDGEKNPMHGKKQSEKTKKLISNKLIDISGENHPNYGKHHSKETIQKMRDSHTGKHHSKETIQKMRDAKLGKNPSEKTKQKMRDSQRKRRAREKEQKILKGE